MGGKRGGRFALYVTYHLEQKDTDGQTQGLLLLLPHTLPTIDLFPVPALVFLPELPSPPEQRPRPISY